MQADWYFDFISPFAYLQLPRILTLRARLDIRPVPILFAAVLDHVGQLGPAEIPAKRVFTYRFVQWQAQRTALRLKCPPAHPFNPIPALRLCLAAGGDWNAVEAIFAHLWRDGGSGDAAALADVGRALGIDDVTAGVSTDAVKSALRANTDRALALGVFGVPTLAIDGQLFWGNDATPMFEDYLADPACFDMPEYRRIEKLPVGVERRRQV